MKDLPKLSQNTSKYSLNALEKHTRSIRISAKKILKEHHATVDKALVEFNNYINILENAPPTLEKNVKLLLGCKFLNHIYSSLLLAESGLPVDAVLCARNAQETIAFHWLVCLDSTAAAEYLSDKVPRPVDVRKRLKKNGLEIDGVRKLYSMDSNLTHVSRSSERFNLEWTKRGDGVLKFGGEFSEQDCEYLFGKYLPMLIRLFSEPNP